MSSPEPGEAVATPPRTDTERTLVEIWTAVLDTRPIGIHDDFLSLGGDSMAAMRCVNRISAAFGVELSIDLFLLEPAAIADVAERLDSLRRAS